MTPYTHIKKRPIRSSPAFVLLAATFIATVAHHARTFFIILLVMLGLTDMQSATAQASNKTQGDTIYFSLPFRYAYDYEIPGIGLLAIFSVDYTLVKKGNNIMTHKSMCYCSLDHCSSTPSSTSEWLEIKDDTLFSWLTKNIEPIKIEEFAPYVYGFNRDSHTCYVNQFINHPSIYSIWLTSGSRTIKKEIELNTLQKEDEDGRKKNLNYPYNTSTHLYRLLCMLEERTKAWDKQYVFKIFNKK